jgi:glyoxylase-like metal-dependent hydrolase (beta-lactamase superfamily II)
MLRPGTRRINGLLIFCSLFALCAFAQTIPPFNASGLIKLGDNIKYDFYNVTKIGEGVYKINDRNDRSGGVDMYVICGATKALMIDLGNNYIDGYVPDKLAARKNAAEDLSAIVYGLIGKLPLEIAITHAHPDHDGMTGAFLEKKVTIWMPEGEDIEAPRTQHKIDPAVYTRFAPGKTFDLGGGRVFNTFLIRGHSTGGTAYLLAKDMLIFTGDALGSGFGQQFATVEKLKNVAEDSKKLVDYIFATFSPYERYALKVHTGHAWQNTVGFSNPNHDRVDVGYLDWRFLQDEAACANGILKGKWLVQGSGLMYVGKMPDPGWSAGRAIMVYGIGTVVLPLEVAYEAAGLKMP